MEENKNPLDKAQEQALHNQQLYEQYLQELKTNQSLQKDLEKYTPSSIESLLQEYAKLKVNVMQWGPNHVKWQEDIDLEWAKLGMECLGQIQQKKLFDLQCQWRAEQVQLPGIAVSFDFMHWEQQILHCPFLPPVTRQEMELYQRFVHSNNYRPGLNFLQSWQNYDAIMKAYNNEDKEEDMFCYMPEWYAFHNQQTGGNRYLLLPNIRGQKELHYHLIWAEKVRDAGKTAEPTPAPANNATPATDSQPATPAAKATSMPTLPRLNWPDDDKLIWFANKFDNQETQTHMNNYRSYLDQDRELDPDPDEIAKELAEESEIWPMEACADWYHGLLHCLASYRHYKIARSLPLAFEQYEMLMDTGIGLPYDEKKDFLKDISEGFRNQILTARHLSGEPEDFNF